MTSTTRVNVHIIGMRKVMWNINDFVHPLLVASSVGFQVKLSQFLAVFDGLIAVKTLPGTSASPQIGLFLCGRQRQTDKLIALPMRNNLLFLKASGIH